MSNEEDDNNNNSITESSSSDDDENHHQQQQTPQNNNPSTTSVATEYEKQRQARIAANNARMQALGLRNLANSLVGPPKTPRKRNSTPKSKRVGKKSGDDDEYEPNEEEESDGDMLSSDSDEEEEGRNRRAKAKRGKVESLQSRSGKKISARKPRDISNFMDEDEALKHAIALSLKDLGETSDLQHGGSSNGSKLRTPCINEKSRNFQKDNTKRQKRKTFTSRVQMTEDDLVIHFCQIDEVGRGSITLKDVKLMAATHDFTWSDKELFDMIHCFDSDGDGKLSLNDFRNIVQRCNMLQGPEVS